MLVADARPPAFRRESAPRLAPAPNGARKCCARPRSSRARPSLRARRPALGSRRSARPCARGRCRSSDAWGPPRRETEHRGHPGRVRGQPGCSPAVFRRPWPPRARAVTAAGERAARSRRRAPGRLGRGREPGKSIIPAMASRDLAALGYRRIVILLVALVVVPTFLLLAVGVILLFLGEAKLNLLLGILVRAMGGAAATGVLLVWVFVRREAILSRLQSDFVSKVSHELRSAVTSIRVFTETLALRRGDAEAESTCIAALGRESSRLQELIDRLLDWGRMESGGREFVMRETDLRSIVQTAVEACEPVRQRRPVDLHVELPA